MSSVIWKRRPIQFTFFVTRRCNAECGHCFYLSKGRRGSMKEETRRGEFHLRSANVEYSVSRGEDDPSRQENGNELSLAEIEKISSSLGSLLWLAFSGGEIFLRSDIAEIAKIFYRENRPTFILLPTNGLLPEVIAEKTEEILRACEKSNIVVKLSIDGIGEENDALRGVKGAFEKTLMTCEMLAKLQERYRNIDLGVNTVFTSANQERMGDILDFVKGMKGVRTHTVSLARGDLSDESLKNVDLEKYNETIGKLEFSHKNEKRGVYGFSGARLKTAQDIVQRRLIYATAKEKVKHTECYAGKLTAVLTETGDVYPCESFNSRIGNVRESGYDIRKMLNGPKGREIVAEIGEKGCFCTHECYTMMNTLFNPASYPALAREYMQI